MSVLSIRPTVLQCYEIVLIVRFMPNNPPDITLPNSVVNSKTQSNKRRILFIFFIYLGNLRSRTYTCSRKLRNKLRSASVCLFCVCLSVCLSIRRSLAKFLGQLHCYKYVTLAVARSSSDDNKERKCAEN